MCVEGKGRMGGGESERVSIIIYNTIASVHLVIEVFHERGLRTRIWPVGLDALNTASQS